MSETKDPHFRAAELAREYAKARVLSMKVRELLAEAFLAGHAAGRAEASKLVDAAQRVETLHRVNKMAYSPAAIAAYECALTELDAELAQFRSDGGK